jgi:GT2 family glycosyltransferase/tetratricopeptide (TPR) repeat protein
VKPGGERLRLAALRRWTSGILRGVAAPKRAADRARDRGDFELAAKLYANALARDPSRTDLRVQRANMLKDCSRFEEAEAEYLLALSQRPLEGDIHLQLGHLYKTFGQRTHAIEQYARAATFSQQAAAADRELAFLADRVSQESRFRTATASGEIEAVLALSSELRKVRDQLDQVLSRMPDVTSQAAFPASQYDTLRRIWDVPPPPRGDVRPASVVMPMDDISHAVLGQVVAALRDQSAQCFQVILVGVESSRQTFAQRTALADPRFEFHDGGANPWDLVDLARHDVIVLPALGAVLHRHALAWFGWAASQTDASAFICDEERRSGTGLEGGVIDPALRQAVDHEILLQTNPFGETLALDRGRCVRELGLTKGSARSNALLTVLLELAARGSIGHIPYPLSAISEALPIAEAEVSDAEYTEVVRAHLTRLGRVDAVEVRGAGARVSWRASSKRLSINVVIPTRDNGNDVKTFVDSLRTNATFPERVHLTVLDNGSVDGATLGLLSQMKRVVDVVRCDEPFNWSRLSNEGATHRETDIVLFANDDMVMQTKGWDSLLQGLLERPEVGVVGAKLLYPDDTIQHAGIIFGWRGQAIHDGLFEPRTAPGPGGRWQLRRRVSAVTGAFFAMRKALFNDIGGFDEQRLAVGYSDLDMSLKVRRRGLAVLYAPELELTHYESKSRGLTHLSASTRALDDAELRVMRSRWPVALDFDVSVHPMWHAATLPFRLLSAPSSEAVMRHLFESAAPDPWRPRIFEDG